MVTDEMIIEACQNADSMSKACSSLDISFATFKRRAIKLNVYKTNQGGKGRKKPIKIDGKNKFSTQDILNGKHPTYQSNKLRRRLLEENIFEHECACCQNREWMDEPIPLELNHIDGNKNNHLLENLELLCPNCHAQTSTYRGRNIGAYK